MEMAALRSGKQDEAFGSTRRGRGHAFSGQITSSVRGPTVTRKTCAVGEHHALSRVREATGPDPPVHLRRGKGR